MFLLRNKERTDLTEKSTENVECRVCDDVGSPSVAVGDGTSIGLASDSWKSRF